MRGLLFYFPVLSLPPAIPYSCHPERKVQGRDPFLIPLSYSNIAHSECVVQQSEVGPLSRVAPPCMNVCVWIELSLTLSPHDAPPIPATSSSSPTLPFHSRWRHWQRGRERALIPKPVGSVHIQTRAFCLCCCEARVRLACREYKSDL